MLPLQAEGQRQFAYVEPRDGGGGALIGAAVIVVADGAGVIWLVRELARMSVELARPARRRTAAPHCRCSAPQSDCLLVKAGVGRHADPVTHRAPSETRRASPWRCRPGIPASVPEGYEAASATGRSRALILHWNGKSWNLTASRLHATADGLHVAATSARNACAVGGTADRAIVMVHWNGTTWKQMT